MARLSAARRKALPKTSFALPSKRSKSGGSGGYPIPDKPHARSAISRARQNATPAQQKTIVRKVHQKFPSIKIAGATNKHNKPEGNRYNKLRKRDSDGDYDND